jgi:hypothetical protein
MKITCKKCGKENIKFIKVATKDFIIFTAEFYCEDCKYTSYINFTKEEWDNLTKENTND